jgi:hypothetical protein
VTASGSGVLLGRLTRTTDTAHSSRETEKNVDLTAEGLFASERPRSNPEELLPVWNSHKPTTGGNQSDVDWTRL